MLLLKAREKNLTYYALFSIVAFETCYITSVSKLSLAYLGWGLALCFFPLVLLYKRCLLEKNCRKIINTVFIYFCYLLFQCLFIDNSKYIGKYIYLFFFNHGIFIITLFFMSYCTKKQIIKTYHCFIIFSIIILFSDFVYRFLHPADVGNAPAFYKWKMNGLMFTDSNYTGFIGMTIFSMLLYLRDSCTYYKRFTIPLVFFLVVLSFSRAAIVCCVLIYMYFFLKKKIHISKGFILFLGVLFFSAFGYFTVNQLSDDSFGTKLALLKGFDYYFHHYSSNLLIGNGLEFSSSNSAITALGNIGYAGHLYIILKVLDIGLIGYILELYIFFIIYRKTKGAYLFLLLPFILCGFSMCPSNLSYFYMQSALLLGFENGNYKQ